MQTHTAISATRNWLQSFIIAYDICPFARRVHEQDRIRYALVGGNDWENLLTELIAECKLLDAQPETETTLLIFPDSLSRFDDYLDFLEIAQQLLIDQGYEGIYQLASFHPHYCFADSDETDAANYTNRSPFPMLHIIREASIEKALQYYPNPETIPQRNMELTRKLGPTKLRALLKNCLTN